MKNRSFEVTLRIEAPDRMALDSLLDEMYDPLSEEAYEMIGDPVSIRDMDERHYQERIRYVEDWNGHGEYFLFEGKWSDEDDWGLDTAFKLQPLVTKDETIEGELISYQALTKIRELMKMDVNFWFAK